jgi:hypothetical protein
MLQGVVGGVLNRVYKDAGDIDAMESDLTHPLQLKWIATAFNSAMGSKRDDEPPSSFDARFRA